MYEAAKKKEWERFHDGMECKKVFWATNTWTAITDAMLFKEKIWYVGDSLTTEH